MVNSAVNFTLEEVESMLLAQEESKFDLNVKASETVYENNMLKTPEGNLKLNAHSGGQMALRCDVPRGVFEWLFTNRPAECDKIMADAWKKYSSEVVGLSKDKLLIRALNVGETQLCRAVLSNRYAVVDNLEIIQAMKMILPGSLQDVRFCGMKQSFHLDNDSLRMKVIMPHQGEADVIDPHNWGWAHFNSEIGAGSWRSLLALVRMQCTNQLQLNSEDMINVRHIGNTDGLERILAPLAEAFDKALKNSSDTFHRYYDLRERKLKDPAETLKLLANKVGIGKKLANRIVTEKLPHYLKETGYTAYSIINSVTEFARDAEEAQLQTFLQEAAGNLVNLSVKDWARAN